MVVVLLLPRGNEIPFDVTQYSIKTDLGRCGRGLLFRPRDAGGTGGTHRNPVGTYVTKGAPWHGNVPTTDRHKGSIVCPIVRSG